MSSTCDSSEATNDIDSLLCVLNYFIQYERNARYREGNLTTNSGADFPETIKNDGKLIAAKIHAARKAELIKIIEQRIKDKKKLSPEVKHELGLIIDTKKIVDLDTILDTLSFYLPKDRDSIKEQAENLILDDSFILCDYILEKYDKSGVLKQPGIIFTCNSGDDGEVVVSKYEINHRALLIIMAGLLDEEIEVLEQTNSKEMLELWKELNSCENQKDIEQIITYIDNAIHAKYPELGTRWIDFSEKEGWKRTHKVFITHEAIDGTFEPIFRKEIENICKLVQKDQDVPKILNRYILGSEDGQKYNSFDSIQESNLLFHLGSYTAEYPVNFKQWSILQLAKNAELLAVSGPPGTGKTTLLKEIVANEFVQKALILAGNWEVPWEEAKYKNKDIFAIMPDLEEINRHSMVVSSTNNTAVDNIGNELAQEVDFGKTIIAAGMDASTKNSSYTGTFCGQMGNKKNFEEKFLTYFRRFQSGLSIIEVDEEKASNVCDAFLKDYREFKEVNESYMQILAYRKQLFIGLKEVANATGLDEKDYLSLQAALSARLGTINREIGQFENEKSKVEVNHLTTKGLLESVENELNSHNNAVQTVEENIRTVQAELIRFYSAHETFQRRTKWRWIGEILLPGWKTFFKQYPGLRYIDDQIEEKRITKEKLQPELLTVTNRASQLQNEKEKLLEDSSQQLVQIKGLDDRLSELVNSRNSLQDSLNAIVHFMQIFIDALGRYIKLITALENTTADELIKLAGNVEVDEKEFAEWHSLANASYLLKIRHRLFKGALDVTEQYILKNRDTILANFDLIYTKGWFARFYNPLEMYDVEQAECLKSLWNTIFLCFPIITTTLHSFKGDSGNFKQLIPDLIGLLLIDEAGQIMPHYLCGPLFRSQRALIVGDAAQMEPIRTKGSEIIDDERFEYMNETEKDKIRIDMNSAQTYANRGSDYWEEMKGLREGVILEDHRRCEESIIEYSNRYIYSNRLRVFKKDNHKKFLGKNLIAIDVRGPKDGKRHINQTEIDFCANVLPELQKEYGNSIAVISPFRAQAENLEKRLGIAAGTVHKFQGQEKDCIIFSLVIDSLDKQRGLVNFVGGTSNMLNVALSRAKKQFIIVGNLAVLENAQNQLGNLYKVIKEKGRIISLFNQECYGEIETSEMEILCRCMAYKPYNLQDTIGQFIQNKFPLGIIGSIAEHQELLRYIVKNIAESLVIHSPWIMAEVGPNTVISEIESQCKMGKSVKVYYGYRKTPGQIPTEGVSNSTFLSTFLTTDYSEGSFRDRAQKAILKLHDILGANLVYNAPTHVKLLIIDDKYAIVGSYNWLSGSYISDRNEVSCIITNKEAVRYLKAEMFS